MPTPSPMSGHARAGSTLPSSLTLFARRVVGWAAGDRLHKELALLALRRAVRRAVSIRRAHFHHADRGSQYCSVEYQAVN